MRTSDLIVATSPSVPGLEPARDALFVPVRVPVMGGQPAPGGVVQETHISILLFIEDRVLKIRKPFRFDFVDFSTESARAEDCRREVELNRRLAPDVYLGVAKVTMGGETLEHCVVMRRLPAERSLAHLVTSESGSAWHGDLRAVAETLAEFHSRADRSAEISNAASIESVAGQFEANVAATARFVGPLLDSRRHDGVVRGVHRYLESRALAFSARIADGQICDGHGDLQASDIYCLDDGPRLLDCLEFDDQLRYGDVASDVAFLVMDLERLGSASAADEFVRYYEESAGTHLPRSLLHFYCALRAYVRTKVACFRHEQGADGAGGEAAELLALAESHLERARIRVILVGGLPGSGKSTLATALGDALGAVVLRTDDFRRKLDLLQVESVPVEAFGRGRYSPERTQEVYDDLVEAARRCLAGGDSVILDASWIDSAHRDQARKLAFESGLDVVELRCTAPVVVTERRVEQRRREGLDPSEATVEVARTMQAIEAPWPTATSINTDRAPESVLADVLGLVGRVGIPDR